MKVQIFSDCVKEGKNPEILFWVGCSGSFDERAKKITKAFVKILNDAKIDFAVLCKEESCTGDPAKRSGNEFLFQMQALGNIEVMNSYNIKKIVTACPHCFNTLKNEYPQLGGQYEVLHHTQFLHKLIEEGRLRIDSKTEYRGKKITFHDPCYLGRIGGELDAPRDVLNGQVVELERHGQDSFCCGAGGAQMWMEEDADKRVNEIRAKEAAATGCGTLAVGCPFCSTMMEDGLKSIDSDMEVMDIAELMWNQMQKNLESLKN